MSSTTHRPVGQSGGSPCWAGFGSYACSSSSYAQLEVTESLVQLCRHALLVFALAMMAYFGSIGPVVGDLCVGPDLH